MARPQVRRGLRGAAGAFVQTWVNRELRRAQLAFVGAWTAEWAFTVALGIVAYDHGGPAAVGVVSLLRMLPAAVVAPFASVYADRWRREHLLVLTSAIRGAASALVALLVALDASIVAVYALAVVATAAGTVFRPVHSALLPSLCRTPTELAGANVVRGMLDSVSILLGPVLAAVLLATSGPSGVFAAAAVASVWSVTLLLRVHPEVMPSSPEHRRVGVVSELVDGLRVVRSSHDLALLIVLTAAQAWVRGALAVFTVVVALDLLDMGDSGVGVLTAAVGTGAVIGSAGASLLVGNQRLAVWFGAGVALWGLPLAVLGVVPTQPGAIGLMLCIGIANALVDLGLFTLMARLAPSAALGRVFGVLECLGALAVGAGSVVASVVIDGVGVQGALVVVGVVSPLLVALSWTRLRRLDATMVVRDREVELLRSVEMLAALPLPAIEQLAIASESVTVPAGAIVFAQGDDGDRCYVIDSGTAEVVGDGDVVTTLGRGQLFGEIALLREVPRTATVRARTELRLNSLCRDEFLPVVTGFQTSAGRATRRVDDQLARYAPVPESRGQSADRSQDR